VLLLLTPANITCMLMLISGAFRHTAGLSHNAVKKRRALYALIGLTLVNVLVLLITFTPQVPFTIILFQGIVLVIAFLVFSAGYKYTSKFKERSKNYLNWFAGMALTIIICLSVLPTCLFTWYAHNQEILQGVKREQLFLASSLDNRKNIIHRGLDSLAAIAPASLYNTLQYARGIYCINDDTIKANRHSSRDSLKSPEIEKFYFDVADNFNIQYYDPQNLSYLGEGAADSLWWWQQPHKKHMAFYYTMKPDYKVKNAQGELAVEDTQIVSQLPQRYIFLGYTSKICLVITIAGLLLLGLYKLIKAIAKGVFMQKFITPLNIRQKPAGENTPPLFAAYSRGLGITDDNSKQNLLQRIKLSIFYYLPGHNKELMAERERRTILKAETFEKYYAFVWSKCSDKEKYLLRNFAVYGFINYKNTDEVYRLLQQGILLFKDEELRLFSKGFRVYILQLTDAGKLTEIEKPFSNQSAWAAFKTPFMVLLFAAAAFIFLTRQETWQKFSALITGVGTSLPLLIGFFKGNGKAK
jgi:hypothetical protein